MPLAPGPLAHPSPTVGPRRMLLTQWLCSAAEGLHAQETSVQRALSVPGLRPAGRRHPGWTAQDKHLLSALPPRGGRCISQGYLLNNIPEDRVYNKGLRAAARQTSRNARDPWRIVSKHSQSTDRESCLTPGGAQHGAGKDIPPGKVLEPELEGWQRQPPTMLWPILRLSLNHTPKHGQP